MDAEDGQGARLNRAKRILEGFATDADEARDLNLTAPLVFDAEGLPIGYMAERSSARRPLLSGAAGKGIWAITAQPDKLEQEQRRGYSEVHHRGNHDFTLSTT